MHFWRESPHQAKQYKFNLSSYSHLGIRSMSGFERILARVSGDALRDYCSSAIEDELRSLKGKMQACLTSVERALEVQDAILKLDVSLADSAGAFAAIQRRYLQFDTELGGFLSEQQKVCACVGWRASLTRTHYEDPGSGAARGRARERQAQSPACRKRDWRARGRAAAGPDPAPPHAQEARRLGAEHDRRRTEHRGAAPAPLADHRAPQGPRVRARPLLIGGAAQHRSHGRGAVAADGRAQRPRKRARRRRRVPSVRCLRALLLIVLRSARELLASKRSQPLPSGASPLGVRVADPQHFNTRTSAVVSEHSPRHKKAKVEHNAVDLVLVKVEGGGGVASSTEATVAVEPFEVHVYDLPWGARQADVEAYFSSVGAIASIRMPTMDDGSTVGVAIIRFKAIESMNTALRMDGFHFQGRSIRVTVPAK
ncbi:hypothetical protein PybrP1_009655 [[Pythium] brassicae (nom. inval.)]|nr:hypothetical protein PybrP1_009655 [[Pythium] brassicae (nom. inval.)]